MGQLLKKLKMLNNVVQTVNNVNSLYETVINYKNLFIRKFLVSTKFDSSSPYFQFIEEWISNNIENSVFKIKSFRGNDLKNYKNQNNGFIDNTMIFRLSSGTYYFNIDGFPLIMVEISSTKDEGKSGGMSELDDSITRGMSSMFKEKISINITFNSTDLGVLDTFKSQIDLLVKQRLNTKSSVFRWSGWDWSKQETYNNKCRANIHLDEYTKNHIFDSISTFLDPAVQKRFSDNCFPYRKGLVLYGAPGTGKSSIAAALANEFNLDLFQINLNTITDDERLMRTYDDLPPLNGRMARIILVEDFDATQKATTNRDDEDADMDSSACKVSLSAVLNYFDGISTPDNTIFIITTNKVESIDPAILREGRFDIRAEIKLLAFEQQRSMVHAFFQDEELLKLIDIKVDGPSTRHLPGSKIQARIIHCYSMKFDNQQILDYIFFNPEDQQ